MLLNYLVLILLSQLGAAGGRAAPYPRCKDTVFCAGPLLHTIQLEELFPRPVDFLYLKMKFPADKIIQRFHWMRLNNFPPRRRKEVLKRFLQDNFGEVKAVEKDRVSDWKKKPPLLKKLKNREAWELGYRLNEMWSHHCRATSLEGEAEYRSFSAIPLPYPFFVASEGEEEMPYADSYWILRGLLECGMISSARGLLLNFFHLVSGYGHIPKASRVYFIGRPSAPLFVPMVHHYVEATGDMQLLQKLLPALEVEFDFWIRTTTTVVATKYHIFFAAFEPSERRPRPEHYLEDARISQLPTDVVQPHQLVNYFKKKPGKYVISVQQTALLEWNARLLSQFCGEFMMRGQKKTYAKLSELLSKTLNLLLYSPSRKSWFDYSASTGYDYVFKIGNLTPLWTGLAGPVDRDEVAEYLLQTQGAEEWAGGAEGDSTPGITSPQTQGIINAALLGNPLGRKLAARWLSSVAMAKNPASYFSVQVPGAASSDSNLLTAAVSFYILSLYPDINIKNTKPSFPFKSIYFNKLIFLFCLTVSMRNIIFSNHLR